MNELQLAATQQNMMQSQVKQKTLATDTNPLLTAAMPLLLLMIRFKTTKSHANPLALRNQVAAEINVFEQKAKLLGLDARTILAARYCICTAIDEVALCTQWGSNSAWSQQSILSIIQKETWGGERFFIILENMLEEPRNNLFILELLYLILSLGYEGKYYNQEKSVRDEIRHRLFQTITMYREQPAKNLSPSQKRNEAVAKPTKQKFNWHPSVAAAGLLLTFTFGFNYATAQQAKPILEQLYQINQSISQPKPVKAIKKRLHRTTVYKRHAAWK